MQPNPQQNHQSTDRLYGHPLDTAIVQVYAPTSFAFDEVLEDFFGIIQDTLDKIPSKDYACCNGRPECKDWSS